MNGKLLQIFKKGRQKQLTKFKKNSILYKRFDEGAREK